MAFRILRRTIGAWGTGIFDDDLAADLQTEWQEALASGSSPSEASAALVTGIGGDVGEDEEDGPVFWITLATLQLDASALDERVRSEAGAAIPRNLDRWRADADDDDVAERERVLTALQQRLAV